MWICFKIRVMLGKLQLVVSLVTDRFKAVIWCNSYFEVLCVIIAFALHTLLLNFTVTD